MKPTIEAFHDPVTSTLSYVVHAGRATPCAIVDAVLDYEPHAGRTSTRSADRIVDYVRAHDLRVEWLLETHAHADHISAAPYLRAHLGGKIAIGEQIRAVQRIFGPVFHLEPAFLPDGSQFDHLFHEGECFSVGALQASVMHVPGHTPADVAYHFDGVAFVGDTLFMPDVGTARCDFPGGDAHTLYQSIQRLLALPDETQLYMCHDYPPDGRALRWHTTVAEQRAANVHVGGAIAEADFIAMRTARDRTLGMPTLIIPSIQLNIQAGKLPEPDSNGTRYLKIPLDVL
ncbi:MBL fold metallo-hydrolase [Burkholderia sp. FERM BP-3421]|jgi:glyoxylase-like metal-dependent hydrolase (beta-lactamase superfamily II)|uniref:MBL fold metallo-hydrolase n=1 Tax=Burkholderia sp. FERM BP-3421 TaxID=1494466 RepID=UPI0023626E9A|nr:MBL fold metallo-hydrolase [Burkholderia sp. FERM BP-3421]WDD91944.1 MBL fold metallo-hydrolase [Burkholderia sp. FERM BP-3421]